MGSVQLRPFNFVKKCSPVPWTWFDGAGTNNVRHPSFSRPRRNLLSATWNIFGDRPLKARVQFEPVGRGQVSADGPALTVAHYALSLRYTSL